MLIASEQQGQHHHRHCGASYLRRLWVCHRCWLVRLRLPFRHLRLPAAVREAVLVLLAQMGLSHGPVLVRTRLPRVRCRAQFACFYCRASHRKRRGRWPLDRRSLDHQPHGLVEAPFSFYLDSDLYVWHCGYRRSLVRRRKPLDELRPGAH
jgi:hypothetical protein